MKICKNTTCNKKIADNRTYCSLKCRNQFVNLNLRDYSNIGNKLRDNKINEYNKSLKHCQNPKCNKVLSYEKRRNKYCDKTCSTSHINTIRECTWGDKIKYGVLKSNQTRKSNQTDKICDVCKRKFISKNKYCSIECSKHSRKQNMSEYSLYKSKTIFKFNLKDFPNEFDFELIKKFGWYKAKNNGNNLNGVSRDHKLSVNDGFKNKIPPELLAHPANCELMVHSDNIRKNKKSSITKDELIERINEWNKKYGELAQSVEHLICN